MEDNTGKNRTKEWETDDAIGNMGGSKTKSET